MSAEEKSYATRRELSSAKMREMKKRVERRCERSARKLLLSCD